MLNRRIPVLLLLTAAAGCAILESDGPGAARARLGTLEPGLRPSPAPASVALGRRLFFDPRLSADGVMSCGTCHKPEAGFSDGRTLAVGLNGKTLKRHTPSLYNIALNSRFFWDGRAGSLEEQALMVIENPDEMGMTLPKIVQRLQSDAELVRNFETAFPGSGLTGPAILSAISDYERSLLSFDSPFDRHLSGEAGALSEPAQRGLALFLGKAGCVVCHNGPNFTDGRFHNTGVLTSDPGRLNVVRNIEFSMRPYPFFGNKKAFKTPTLRNARLSPPYFHNGSVATLEEVVAFYNRGGRARDPEATSPDVHPLGLTALDSADLVAFLDSLTSGSPELIK